MGSDFQRVKVLEVGDREVVLQVTEEHPDMDAVHALLTTKGKEYLPRALAAPLSKTTLGRGKAFFARNFAAQLLYSYGDSGFKAAAERESEEVDGDPYPDRFIARVVVRELKPLRKASNGGWLYRAALVIALKREALTRGFKPGRSYPARACPTGDWEMV
jgi:hypothetical protein